MGGHGGLNILPQKKWNVYRKDAQYKVHYDEHKIIKEEKDKEIKRKKDEFESTISTLKKNMTKNEDSDNNYNNFYDENGEKKTTTNYCNDHINLFIDEEKELTAKQKKHEEFLIKKGHYIYYDKNFNTQHNSIYDKNKNAQIISDFNKMKLCERDWFLNKKNKNEKTKDNGANFFHIQKDNISEEHNKTENINSDLSLYCNTNNYITHDKKKEKKQMHYHIKKIIKYKQEKDKEKKRKRQREREKKKKNKNKKKKKKNE
ncbi:hypothetical protein PFMG_04697 [Plasmodium falciparum IGH-CR14]|uniref:CBF1-interacting co-repressor CIR N-terminal domain-containing protein n=4 Tax=Plasmodium falciparum TaxID=5833 RepID=Q9Y011_PLAF7|nr:conserved protein, unknown function [Plasmodium falciparum 3D7]KAF4328888.1 hypothetical protein CYL21_3102 [Plasmodium falciparum NF54]KNG78502.1 hypothetical protein PFMG_04697 [Plasmodium falciparum IGH-CR14]CAB41709.2 conserved protein, unknown function [Plasmodium falciparum 3D7]|eukprot:XP_001351215.2 conserved Plasmodium protein, unknown function [Plasmodium falciparum 3D7]